MKGAARKRLTAALLRWERCAPHLDDTVRTGISFAHFADYRRRLDAMVESMVA